MLYKKPKDITYTEMAIYIDTHMYEEDCDESLVFEYLYHLCYMLAKHANYFRVNSYYDDFAVYAATSVFMRYKNKKQFELDDAGNPKMTKLRSCLNYIKTILYPKKVDFEQRYYSQLYSPSDVTEEKTGLSLDALVSQTVDDLNTAQFNLCLGNTASTCRRVIRDIPYKTNKTLWNNIYLSCLLTFISNLTLSEKNKQKIREQGDSFYLKPEVLEDLYREESGDIVLYHLEDNMKDYIRILTTKMKKVLSKDLSLSLHEYISSDGNIQNILLSQVEVYDEV